MPHVNYPDSAPSDTSSGPRILVLASGNAGKLRELTAMLAPLGWEVRPQSDWAVSEAVEDGITFLENALIKARHASELTGQAALGDDSGLVVDALQGRPGIYSSRFAGVGATDQENNSHLLDKLTGIPDSARTAHFYCVMVTVRHPGDPAPLVSSGRWDGVILNEPKGGGGFGYDPLFWVPSRGCTSAELPPGEKNRISHRAIALQGMIGRIENEF
jgi:XTP/dITP diphosphohydrolase